MNHIVREESGYVTDAIGDMNIKCKKTGKPVRARGLVQITECWWPKVTDIQANDPDFALDFLASWISKGHCSWWSTCPIKK